MAAIGGRKSTAPPSTRLWRATHPSPLTSKIAVFLQTSVGDCLSLFHTHRLDDAPALDRLCKQPGRWKGRTAIKTGHSSENLLTRAACLSSFLPIHPYIIATRVALHPSHLKAQPAGTRSWTYLISSPAQRRSGLSDAYRSIALP